MNNSTFVSGKNNRWLSFDHSLWNAGAFDVPNKHVWRYLALRFSLGLVRFPQTSRNEAVTWKLPTAVAAVFDVSSASCSEGEWEPALRQQIEMVTGGVPSLWFHLSALGNVKASILESVGGKLIKWSTAPSFVEAAMRGVVSSESSARSETTVCDVFQLRHGLERYLEPMVEYVVEAKAIHPKIMRTFLKWMDEEHGPEMLMMSGAIELNVVKTGADSVKCRYIFDSQKDLENYLANLAPQMRQKSLIAFPDHLMSFSRKINEFWQSYA